MSDHVVTVYCDGQLGVTMMPDEDAGDRRREHAACLASEHVFDDPDDPYWEESVCHQWEDDPLEPQWPFDAEAICESRRGQ